MSHIGLDNYQQGEGPTWSRSGLQSAPGPMVLAGDFLRLSATTLDATGALTLNGRLVDTTGVIRPFNLTMTFSGAGTQTAKTTPLMDGWIMGFTCYVSSGTITDGEVQATIEVVQGSGTGATSVMCLASGEVTNVRKLGLGAWPHGQTSSSPMGLPVATTIASLTPPAANNDFSIDVPAGKIWHITSVMATYHTDNTVANRELTLILQNGISTGAYLPSGVNQTASLTWNYTWAVGCSRVAAAAATSYILPLPDWYLVNPAQLMSIRTNGAAGDAFTEIVYAYQEFTIP